MKFIILAIILLLNSLYADDLHRVNDIVNDITKLKTEYKKVGDNLAMCRYNLQDEKEKNAILLIKLKQHYNAKVKEQTYKNKIASLENQIKNLNKELLLKEKSNNSFPNLKMKVKQLRNKTKAFAYRMHKDTNIYDGIDGKIIDRWEKDTSFTSNQKTRKWIKITGFFVEKIWRPTQKEMWVKVADADKR